MKRRSTEGLSESLFLFSTVYPGATLAEVLARPYASVGDGSARRVVLVLMGYPATMLEREWMCGLPAAKLESYSHHSRTAVYGYNGRTLTVMSGENWFTRSVVMDDPFVAPVQFEMVQRAIRTEFRLPFFASPTLTGLHALESKIPFGVESCQNDGFNFLIHPNMTQSRNEFFLRDSGIDEFLYYDRRFAYAADALLDMPCGEPEYTSYPDARFEKYETAFYEIEFSVPVGWGHVGILPARSESGDWCWPVSGTHRAFVAEPELRAAADVGWRFEVLRKWKFASGRPFEKPVKSLVALFESYKRNGFDVSAGIVRRLVLQAIGAMYARSYEREQVIDEAELLGRNDAAVLTAEAQPDGRYSLRDRSERRESRFYAPIWTAYVWSRARARLAQAMLGLPRESVLGCHVDAIYTDREALTIEDNGRVGQFRLKGRLIGLSQVNVSSLSDLQKIKTMAELSGVSDGR